MGREDGCYSAGTADFGGDIVKRSHFIVGIMAGKSYGKNMFFWCFMIKKCKSAHAARTNAHKMRLF